MVIQLQHIKKIYNKNGIEAVKDFNLTIEDKEFVVFVGPSGCGKSTTLRMIAGLEDITEGEIKFDGKVINNVSPGERNVAMVFQSYALYPNMSVYKNMEFPLKMKKVPKHEREVRIMNAAKMLGLTDYLQRKPKNLSGGQRQRVALGREIVRDVDLFLMDEPLSNLDAKLRVQMRSEITKLHKKLQKTFIYVTHDQVEAMTMATKIVIMKDGKIQQVGSPKEVYDYPDNIFVGGFIGTPAMNFINGKINREGYFISDNLKIMVPKEKYQLVVKNSLLDQPIILGIRPEDISIIEDKNYNSSSQNYRVKIDSAELFGSEYNLIFYIGQQKMISKIKANRLMRDDQEVNFAFDLLKCHLFDPKTTLRLS